MATTSHHVPAAELIRRLPPPDEIRRRLDELSRERKALQDLLKAAQRAQRQTGGAT